MRVLVVDDDIDVLTMLGEALTLRGHDLATARTGEEAVEVATRFCPDVALVDVILPDVNGITLASLVRGAVPGKDVRIVGYSGWSAHKMRVAVERGVFDQYVIKPASIEQIEEVLRPSGNPVELVHGDGGGALGRADK
jgi:DNA-binding response OmpR family regulator